VLITNFAAGELSETLFGRTDLPQYYQGAARLENFDVIPTGGIRRRRGTRRMAALPREMRIISFILDRETHYLLGFFPRLADDDGGFQSAAVQFFKNGAPHGEPVLDGTGGISLPATMREINELQYAQDYRTMIVAHANYPPLMITLTDDGPAIQPISINILVDTVKKDGLIDPSPNEQDKTYAGGYLTGEGQYPACVTFFNGRLVFAATKLNRQRIFASRVNDYTNFSTYKRYLTEKREYTVIRGTAVNGSRIISVDPLAGPLSFTRNITDYFVDSELLFPAGTKIVKVYSDTGGMKIEVTSECIFNPPQIPGEPAAVTAWKNEADYYEANPNSASLEAWSVYFPDILPDPNIVWRDKYGVVYAHVTYLHLVVYKPDGSFAGEDWLAMTQSDADRVKYTDNANYDWLRLERVKPWLRSFNEAAIFEDGPGRLGEAITRLGHNLVNYWFYQLQSDWYYGTPDSIYQRIMNLMDTTTDAYIPFYASDLLIDEYATPEDGFTFEIASDMSDAIKWLAQNKALVVGTETAEWIVPRETTAVNIQAILNSRYGSDRVQATTIGDAVVFLQSGKKSIVEYYIPQQDSNFRANNMAMLSDAMLRESPAFDLDFVSTPYTKICISREDGTVAALLYERSAGTFAWGRITTRGAVRSVAAIPGPSGYDELYLVVQRDGLFFLERLAEDDGTFLDSFRQWDGDGDGYAGDAVVYDERTNRTFPLSRPDELPPAADGDHPRWIGYLYRSVMRTMPVLANDRMRKQRITGLAFRFLDSFLPDVTSLAGGRAIQTDTISNLKEPYSGVHRIPFPGAWDEDAQAEITCDQPAPVTVLALNAEAQ
jgi:hypothetical protein